MGRKEEDRKRNRHRNVVPAPLSPTSSQTMKLMASIRQEVSFMLSKPSARELGPALQIDDSPVAKALAEVALNCWRLKRRLVDPETEEPLEGMSMACRHVDALHDGLKALGLEIEDRTGQTFDVGLVQRAIAYEPTPGILKETVIKTVRPTIRLNGQLIDRGEVVVGTPKEQKS